jgi:hypothetical protein
MGVNMRRFAQLVGVLAALVALTSCYGRSATTGIDVTVDCKVGFGGGGATDLGTFAQHFTLDAPVWATPGAVIPLSNPTDGGPETQIPVTGLKAIRVSTSGLASFQESADFNGNSQTLTDAFVAVTPGDQFESASTGVTAHAGSIATVDFTSFTAVVLESSGSVAELTCTPLAGQPTRLATIKVRGRRSPP